MSFSGQIHHPHSRGNSPNQHLLTSNLPVGLNLLQAHWYIRHGERTPVKQRMTGLAKLPAVFNLCSIARQFDTSVLSLAPSSSSSPSIDHSIVSSASDDNGNNQQGAAQVEFMSSDSDLPTWTAASSVEVTKKKLKVRRLTEDQGNLNKSSLTDSAECYWGELTDLGRQSTLSLGSALRSLYVTQSSFLSPYLNTTVPREEAEVTFRSTGMNRTIESLHQVVEGLFPAGFRKGQNEGEEGRVDFVVRSWEQESLYPNGLCVKMKSIDKEYASKAAELYNPTLWPLDALIGKYIGGPIRIDGSPRANGILDTIMVCKAHGIKVPSEFEDVKVLETLEAAVVHEWFDAYQNPTFRKLAMGRLLGDLRHTIDSKVKDSDSAKLKLAIYSCHDTSLAGILNALDCFDKRWPPFTSHISFELFSRPPSSSPSLSSSSPSYPPTTTTTTEDHFVRVQYNSKSLALPACSAPGDHLEGSQGTICTLEAFRKAVEKVEITAEEWGGISSS